MLAKCEDSPYFANGFIGSMIYSDTTASNMFRIQVFRTDVQEKR